MATSPRLASALLVTVLVAAASSVGCSSGRRAAPPASTATAPAPGPSASGHAGGVSFAGHDLPLEEVTARCRQTGKPAMLYLVTTWCGYCRKLEQETLPSPEVGRHMAGYVNVAYSCDSGVGRQVAQKYGVTGYPTLVSIDATGAMRGKYEGFDPPSSFVQRIPRR
jgi:thiol-disulfide isomerase/thioredoxin